MSKCLIRLAFSVVIVKSECLRTTDNLGMIIAGYVAVSILIMFGVEWLVYRRGITQKVNEAGSQRKEIRSEMGNVFFAFAALMCSAFDCAKDMDDVSGWWLIGVFCLLGLVSTAAFCKYVSSKN